MRAPLPTLAVTLAAAGLLTGCGSHGEENIRFGETEGIYLDVGAETGPQVKYQVQIFRQLNARNPTDAAYLSGLRGLEPGEDPETVLTKDAEDPTNSEVFVAAFVAAFNENDQAQPVVPQANFELEDTQDNRFSPIPIDARENPFAWTGGEIEAAPPSGSSRYPIENSPAGSNTARGGVLVFKIPQTVLENRPIELIIEPPGGGEPSIVDLDV